MFGSSFRCQGCGYAKVAILLTCVRNICSQCIATALASSFFPGWVQGVLNLHLPYTKKGKQVSLFCSIWENQLVLPREANTLSASCSIQKWDQLIRLLREDHFPQSGSLLDPFFHSAPAGSCTSYDQKLLTSVRKI